MISSFLVVIDKYKLCLSLFITFIEYSTFSLYDYYLAQKDLKLIERNIVTTNNTFYLEGWMPQGCKINNNKEFIIKVRPEEENEEVPVLVQDNRIVEPFQSITNIPV